MPDENVDKWRQQGHIYLWKYLVNTRNYPGWHLTANETFYHSFSELIKRMKAAQFNCQKSLKVTSPTKEILSIPSNRVGEAEWEAPKNLILKHQKDQISDN